MPVTDATCKNAKCPEGRNFQQFSDAGGLYLEATKSGAKLRRLKYRQRLLQTCGQVMRDAVAHGLWPPG